MRFLPVLACGAAAALALGLEACGQSCNAVGCGAEGLTVQFEARCWPDGSYEVSGTLDGEPFSIPVELPGSSVPGAGGVAVQASARFGIEALQVNGRPRTVEVRIRRGELPIAEARLTPQYERYYPNGEECGPTCVVATESVPVAESAANELCDLLEVP